MNLCTPGNCICDAREWEGDTNCMGEVYCLECKKDHQPGPCPQSKD